MAKKRYFIVGVDENDPFQIVIVAALVVGALFAVFFAAVFLLPILAAGSAALWWYRSRQNSPAAIAKRDIEEIRNLHSSVKYLADKMKIPTAARLAELVIKSVDDKLSDTKKRVPPFMYATIEDGCGKILAQTGLEPLPPINEAALAANVNARHEIKHKLYELQTVYQAGERGVDEVYWYLCNCVGHICKRLPAGDGFGDEPNAVDFTVEIQDVLGDVHELVEILLYLPFGEDEKPTLAALQKHSLSRMAAVSGKRVDELIQNPHKTPKPTEDKRNAREVINAYLGGWPLLPLLWGRVAYRLPAEARFEHMHVLGGTGHGKTQLLQRFIREDLSDIYFAHRSTGEEPNLKSLVVMDGQGDLIKNISTRAYCAPHGPLDGKVILIDPTDVDHPPALNMFDLDRGELERMNPVDREMVYNGTIELYVYLFGALLDAKMTTRQATMFRFLAELLLEIPGATLDTLRDVLENGEDYQPYIDKLPYASQQFFQTQFLSGELEDTKEQVRWRVWGILSNKALANMFNSPKNKIDLFAEMQRGTVILINTSKDFLKTDGSKIFGRFWVAMLAQAALRRAATPPANRVGTHVYLDEAHEVIDEKVEEILNQARKYRIGLTLAHQNQSQLSAGTKNTIAASTSIKMLGGVSEEDAKSYAGDLRTDADTILRAKKRTGGGDFVTFVKNVTPTAITLNVPFGVLEQMDRMDHSEYTQLRENVRVAYCRNRSDEPAPGKPETGDTAAPKHSFELGDHEDL